jgi:cell division protease FtsH
MTTENQNKKSIKEKLNPNGIPGKDGDPKKKPRLSIYWVYGVMVVLLLGYNYFYRGPSSTGAEIDNTQFYQMLKQGDVSEIKTVGNKKLVRVTLKKEKLAADSAGFYKTVFGANFEQVKKMVDVPQAYFKIIKDEVFATQLASFYKDNPQVQTVPDKPDDEGEIFGQILGTILPLLLIVLVFVMMMRKMGGGGGAGGPGGIFSIGKSKATLFEKGTKVNIN